MIAFTSPLFVRVHGTHAKLDKPNQSWNSQSESQKTNLVLETLTRQIRQSTDWSAYEKVLTVNRPLIVFSIFSNLEFKEIGFGMSVNQLANRHIQSKQYKTELEISYRKFFVKN
jgi:hypothetical protein